MADFQLRGRSVEAHGLHHVWNPPCVGPRRKGQRPECYLDSPTTLRKNGILLKIMVGDVPFLRVA